MALAPVIGRQEAHKVGYKIAHRAAINGTGMKEALMAAPEIIGKLSEREIDAILDPTAYTGLCAQFVDGVLEA